MKIHNLIIAVAAFLSLSFAAQAFSQEHEHNQLILALTHMAGNELTMGLSENSDIDVEKETGRGDRLPTGSLVGCHEL